jgi:RNA polymerase sigma-70 factor (ECF subfamily)
MSDETKEILLRLQSDDKAFMKDLFHDHYSMVCKTIYRFINEQPLTEDLAQEVFIRLWNKRHQLNINQSFPAYLRRMAINEALGHIRKNKKVQIDELNPGMHEGMDSGTEEKYLYVELKDRIAHAIEGLPPRCRIVFQLSRFEELTYKEIAEKLDISIKTVENQMGKALKILREKLKGYMAILGLICFCFMNLL